MFDHDFNFNSKFVFNNVDRVEKILYISIFSNVTQKKFA